MSITIANVLRLLLCHLVGDYVLQSDFIAKTKGENWYHLLVHCTLYCIPFYIFFGLNWQILIIFGSHIMIDAAKARFKKINYVQDQILHYIAACIYFI